MGLERINWNLWFRMKTRFLAPYLKREPEPQQWLFILGCYNSGTTLLHRLLSMHPDIGSMPNEGQFFTDQLPRGRDFGLPRLWAVNPGLFQMDEHTVSKIDIGRLKKEWAWFYNDPHRPVLMDKTILNAARSRWLQMAFPGSAFICLFRDPFAVVEGIHRKEGHPISVAAKQWAVSNAVLLDDMKHLDRCLDIRYENLTAETQSVMKSITDFLGLSALPEDCFKGEFNIHRERSQVRNMNTDSMNRLSDNEKAEILEICSETMQRLGYR